MTSVAASLRHASGPGLRGLSSSDRRQLTDSLTTRLGSEREARWIIEHIEAMGPVGKTRSRWIGGSSPLATAQRVAREAYTLASRRQAGEPLQYVLGEWPFRGLHLQVDQRVLIPRPETEQVVEVALHELRKHCSSGGREDRGGRADDAPRKGPVCVDLGTGSGAIALSLATEAGELSDGIEVWATDSSPDALAVADANRHFVVGDRAEELVRLAEGSWYGALPADLVGRIDLIVSNPPYVPEEHFECLDTVVRDWEPIQALLAPRGSDGAAGFGYLQQVIAGAPRWLGPAGVLVVELDPSQADAALATARSAGLDRSRIECDLSGRRRMLVAVQAL